MASAYSVLCAVAQAERAPIVLGHRRLAITIHHFLNPFEEIPTAAPFEFLH